MRNEEERLAAHRAADKKWREKKIRENPYKKCTKCGGVKPITEFACTCTTSERKFGARCKDCRHEKYVEGKEMAIYRATQYYQANSDTVKARQQARRKGNLAHALFISAKTRSRAKGIPFNIDESDVKIPETCPALGIALVSGVGAAHDYSPSIDRIDPTKGYIKGNVIVVSYLANTIKTNATVEQIQMVAAFYARLAVSKEVD